MTTLTTNWPDAISLIVFIVVLGAVIIVGILKGDD